MKKILLLYFPAAFLFSCTEKPGPVVKNIPGIIVPASDPALHIQNGTLYYGNQLFSGNTLEKYSTGVVRSNASFKNGREHGITETFYENGEKETVRFYTAGEKDSIHQGRWPGGQRKFEYHFKKGNYDGPFTEWYGNGQMNQQIIYVNGKELSGKGWRENGKPYMNFSWKGNRRYGLVNPNMCYGVEKGK
ncbi:MAG: hypothetical protein WKF88_01770 [Ferruginibacter sp.]